MLVFTVAQGLYLSRHLKHDGGSTSNTAAAKDSP
jgi:hypothetical protein